MANNEVVLKRYGDTIREEAVANEAGIKPGHLVEYMSTGKVRKHATAGGNAEMSIAVIDDLQGNDLNDAYTVSMIVQYEILRSGDVFYGFCKNGASITRGDFVESAGDGTFQTHTPDVQAFPDSSGNVTTIYSNQILARALESVDMTGSSGEDPSGRIQLRVV